MEGLTFHVLCSPFCVLTNFCFCCHVYFQSSNQVLFRIRRPLQFRTDGVYDQTGQDENWSTPEHETIPRDDSDYRATKDFCALLAFGSRIKF